MEKQQETAGRKILIGWLGDMHLRDRQYASPKRGDDFKRAAMGAVQSCIDKKVDVIVCAGDLFNQSYMGIDCIGRVMEMDRRLRKAGIPMLTVMGNHDHTSPSWISTLFPAVMRHDGIIDITDNPFDLEGFYIGGLDHRSAAAFRSDREQIEKYAKGLDVLVYHGFVRGIVDVYTPLDVLDVEDFPAPDRLKAILMGDIHHQQTVRHRHVLMGYCGSTEVCNKSEPFEKSVPVVELTEAGAEVVETLPIETRPFLYHKVVDDQSEQRLIDDLKRLADRNPMVMIEFDRDTRAGVVRRAYSMVDPQQAIIRPTPLPSDKTKPKDQKEADDEDLPPEWFMRKRFEAANVELQNVSERMMSEGQDDAVSVLQAYVDRRKKQLAPREDET